MRDTEERKNGWPGTTDGLCRCYATKSQQII